MAAIRVNPGDVLGGKYRVERVLGSGGMGVVVAAKHIELGQLEQLPVDGRMHSVRFGETLVSATEFKHASIAMRQAFFSTVQMTGKPVHSHLVRDPDASSWFFFERNRMLS